MVSSYRMQSYTYCLLLQLACERQVRHAYTGIVYSRQGSAAGPKIIQCCVTETRREKPPTRNLVVARGLSLDRERSAVPGPWHDRFIALGMAASLGRDYDVYDSPML